MSIVLMIEYTEEKGKRIVRISVIKNRKRGQTDRRTDKQTYMRGQKEKEI